jgi:uncharacterized protein YutE (UPF0331/DUF86 family)
LVDREVFDQRLARLEELLRRLRGIAGSDRARYLDDPGLQAQTERWLHLASECCLDLAHHLIADRGWRTPDTYRDAFVVLREERVLDAELAQRMAAWAGLRNVLVHLYLDVDQVRLWAILQEDLDDIEAFAAAAARAARPEGA